MARNIDPFERQSEDRLPQKFVVHEYTWACCGFGDFLRSALTLQKICSLNQVEYFIHFPDHPFRELFYYKKPPMTNEEINNIPLYNMFHFPKTERRKESTYFVKSLKDKKVGVRLRSNVQFIYPAPNYCPMDSILVPKEEVLLQKDKYLAELSLSSGNYNSLHIRMGDKFLDKKLPFTENDIIIIEKIVEEIHKIIHDDPERKLLLFSDTRELKEHICQGMPEVLKVDTQICHVGRAWNKDIRGYIDMICEFLLLGEGDRIYYFAVPEMELGERLSQFVMWSAIVHGKNLVKVPSSSPACEIDSRCHGTLGTN